MATLKHIEIGDYEPRATPPPPSLVGDLYRIAARQAAQCADASQHATGSHIRDLLEADGFAKFSALAYFDAHQPSQACAMLHEAEQYYRAAVRSPHPDNLDRAFLHVEPQNIAAIRKLLASRCRS